VPTAHPSAIAVPLFVLACGHLLCNLPRVAVQPLLYAGCTGLAAADLGEAMSAVNDRFFPRW
jgi:hypothetical protein